MSYPSLFTDLLENPLRGLREARARKASRSGVGSLRQASIVVAASLVLLAAPACESTPGGEGGGSASTGAGMTCTEPASLVARPTPAECMACEGGCFYITPELFICADRKASIATACSPDIPAVDNKCACEGRTCAAGQECYKEIVVWDNSDVHNVCGPAPECLTTADCGTGEVCVLPFYAGNSADPVILSNPGGVCVTPTCHRDSDCQDGPCGVCGISVKQVSINSGRYALDGIKCGYGNALE